MDFIYRFVSNALEIYSYLIIGYVLLSWFPNARDSFIGQILGKIVEPYVGVFRRFIPPIAGLDLSPIAALFALRFISVGILAVLSFIFNMING
ncbi:MULTISPECIES: YggT family protein [unclassified Paenibacillus]|uniref:YggT family protein n=1 Tax=unclassified Paenibacillus TaxID=185978 RepID=UPI002F3F0D24